MLRCKSCSPFVFIVNLTRPLVKQSSKFSRLPSQVQHCGFTSHKVNHSVSAFIFQRALSQTVTTKHAHIHSTSFQGSFLTQLRNISQETQHQTEDLLAKERAELRNCSTVQDVMAIWKRNDKDVNLIPFILKSLIYLVKEDAGNIQILSENSLFAEFGHQLQENLSSLADWALYSSVYLHINAFEKDLEITEALLNQVKGLIPNMLLDHLMKLENLLKEHTNTHLRSMTLEEISAEIKARWDFKNSRVTPILPADIVKMMNVVSEEFQEHNQKTEKLKELEDMALEMHQSMNIVEINSVLYILAKHGHRHTPLIHALTTRLNQHSNVNLNIKSLTNLTYSCAVLNIYDRQLLSTISKNMLRCLNEIRGNEIKLLPRFLHSVCALRWRDEVLIDSIVDIWLIKTGTEKWHHQEYSAFHEILNSCAHVQYLPSSLKDFLSRSRHSKRGGKELLEDVRSYFLGQQASKWLNICFDLAVFKILPKSSAASVLNREFLEKIKIESNFANFSKIMAINSAAELELTDYKQPKLDDETIKKFVFASERTSIISHQKDRSGFKLLLSTLAVMGASQKYVKTHTYTSLGHLCDLEFYVNSSGQIQPFPDKEINSDELKRVAVKLIEFPHKTLFTDAVIGKMALDIRHMQKLGLNTVLINVSDLQTLENDVQRVQYFQDKIKLKIAKPLAPTETIKKPVKQERIEIRSILSDDL